MAFPPSMYVSRVTSTRTALSLLVLALPALATAAPSASLVEKLPLITVLTHAPTPVALRGDLSAKRARQMERVARAVIDDVGRRFAQPAAAASHPVVDVCLFETSAHYQAFVSEIYGPGEIHSDMGFYVPSLRLVLVNLQRGVGNLRHELAHALVGDDYPAIPAWFNEGIGSLYGTARIEKSGVRFLVNYRLRDLQQALRSDTVPSLHTLAHSDRLTVYGPQAMLFYATARYLLLYLDHKGSLSTLYRELRSSDSSSAAHLAILQRHVDEPAFVAWAKTLRWRGR